MTWAISEILRRLRSLRRNTFGGLGVIAGLSLPVVVGATGLAFDINRGLQQQVANQRAADMAALGAAMAFKASSNIAVLDPSAKDIVLANGITGATVHASIQNDFPAAGDQSVRVTVTTDVPYTLARVLGFSGQYDVQAQAFASLISKAQYAPVCLLALSTSSDALKTSGGGSINAPDCSVAAVGSIDNRGSSIQGHDIISGGANISNNHGSLLATTLRFAGSFSNPAWNSNVPPADKRINQPTDLADPWAGNEEVLAARSLIGNFTPVPTLSNPNTPAGADWSFNYSPAANVAGFRVGWSNTYNVPAGNYTIGSLSVQGGIVVNFASGSNITIADGFRNNGSAVNFGDSNIYVNGGFDSGSSGVTIGAGALHIGSGTIKFQGTNRKGDGTVIMNDTPTLGGGSEFYIGSGDHYFGGLDLKGGGSMTTGNGKFVAVNGVTIAGNTELSIGDGEVILGPNSHGNAIELGGSSRFLTGDGRFSANGNIRTQGNSKLAFGRTPNHYINGDLEVKGSALFGRGRYTINGDFENGTGGSKWPFTSSLNGVTYGNTLEGVYVGGYDMAGVDVTFVLAGTLNLGGGAKTKLVAPASSVSGGQIADLLLDSVTTSDTTWGAGSGNNFAGTVHLPNSKVTMSGGNTTLSSGQCFSLIASKIWATGGASTGSSCPSMDSGGSSGGSSTIRLVR